MTSTSKKIGNLQGTRRADALNGNRIDETLQGGAGEDTLNGGKGDDVIVGGEGADDFELSAGNDVIQDFNWREGDQIVLPVNIDRNELQIQENKDGIVIKIKDKFRTIVESGNLANVIGAISDKLQENALDNEVPSETTKNQTIINTGLITPLNKSFRLPTIDEPKEVAIFDSEGKKLRTGYTLDGNEITINKINPG